MKEIYRKYQFSDMTVIYVYDTDTGLIGMMLIPTMLEDKVTLDGNWRVESLIQVKVVGDPYPDGFSHGHTMRNSRTARELKLDKQNITKDGDITVIITTLQSDKLVAIHKLVYQEGKLSLTIGSEIWNRTQTSLGIEMLSSFSICGFSSLEEKERMCDFSLHRLRSKWSAEGRLETLDLRELQLEPSWMHSGVQSIRYGGVGSMPVRGFFPWMALEDKKYGYTLGSQLYLPSSWQIEVYNRDDRIACSGGIADREFGHWLKYLGKDEVFTSPEAVLTVCIGDVEEASYRLTYAQKDNLERVPEVEKQLPIIFNEFCTTWGKPSASNIDKLIHTLKSKGIYYCVIDAGWYAKTPGDWGDIGDWDINQELFPGGFKDIAEKIRNAGMIPGLWFELECVGRGSKAFDREEFLLKRDGIPIQTGIRRFLDMTNPKVLDHLTEKVIGLLKKYNFGYLKVDYNDNLGIGCEGSDSLGEGLRLNMLATQEFFGKIRRELPDLVIENCSSGGHRLEPSMMALTSMSSFSDAHECNEIPIIAANVHRAILPAQSQIWAVLRHKDSDKRLYYSLVGTLLGRMCLSGDVYDLSTHQWKIVQKGIEFYQKAAQIIRDGRTYRVGGKIESYNHPTGWQAVLRKGEQDHKILIVIHTFDCKLDRLEIPLKCLKLSENSDTLVSYSILEELHREHIRIDVHRETLVVDPMEDFEGVGIILQRNNRNYERNEEVS